MGLTCQQCNCGLKGGENGDAVLGRDDNGVYCKPCYARKYKAGDCAKCGKAIAPGVSDEAQFVKDDIGRLFHQSCFSYQDCPTCGVAIKGDSVIIGETHYHPECVRCASCDMEIESSFFTFEGYLVCPNCDSQEKLEQLKARKQSGSLKTPPPAAQSARKNSPDTGESDGIDKCESCKMEIFSGQITMQDKKTHYHKECFVCGGCTKQFEELSFVRYQGAPWHQECYQATFSTTCSTCHGQLISEFVIFDDHHYHRECLVCNGCKTELDASHPISILPSGPACQKCSDAWDATHNGESKRIAGMVKSAQVKENSEKGPINPDQPGIDTRIKGAATGAHEYDPQAMNTGGSLWRRQVKVNTGKQPSCGKCQKTVYHAERDMGPDGTWWHRECRMKHDKENSVHILKDRTVLAGDVSTRGQGEGEVVEK
eukprot:Clim_evm15s206 gene=Clim_evmTU15s206